MTRQGFIIVMVLAGMLPMGRVHAQIAPAAQPTTREHVERPASPAAGRAQSAVPPRATPPSRPGRPDPRYPPTPWLGPVYGNRAPVYVIDLGVNLIACVDGHVETASVGVSGLRYELTEACRNAVSQGHIEVSGMVGQKAGPQAAAKSASRENPRKGVDPEGGPTRRMTRCDPATCNCQTGKREEHR